MKVVQFIFHSRISIFGQPSCMIRYQKCLKLSELSPAAVCWTPCKWNLPVTTSNFPQNVNLKSRTVNNKTSHFSEELYFKTLNQNFLKLCGGGLSGWCTTLPVWSGIMAWQFSIPPLKKKNMILKSRILNKQKKKSVWKGGYKSGIKYSIIKRPFLDLLYVVRLIVKLTK